MDCVPPVSVSMNYLENVDPPLVLSVPNVKPTSGLGMPAIVMST